MEGGLQSISRSGPLDPRLVRGAWDGVALILLWIERAGESEVRAGVDIVLLLLLLEEEDGRGGRVGVCMTSRRRCCCC